MNAPPLPHERQGTDEERRADGVRDRLNALRGALDTDPLDEDAAEQERRRPASRTTPGGSTHDFVPPRTLRRSNSIRRSGFHQPPSQTTSPNRPLFESNSSPARHALARRSNAPEPDFYSMAREAVATEHREGFSNRALDRALNSLPDPGSEETVRLSGLDHVPDFSVDAPPMEAALVAAEVDADGWEIADGFDEFSRLRRSRDRREAIEEVLGISSSAAQLGNGDDQELPEGRRRTPRTRLSTFAPSNPLLADVSL